MSTEKSHKRNKSSQWFSSRGAGGVTVIPKDKIIKNIEGMQIFKARFDGKIILDGDNEA